MSLPEAALNVPRRVLSMGRDRGLVPVLLDSLYWGFAWALGRLGLGEAARGSFAWEGRRVPYFRHGYNYTWLNERGVEVALAKEVLAANPAAKVLEVGNVTGHYLSGTHDVVDKYESAPGVQNIDVVDLETRDTYDLVVAISTLEHVGLDEDVLEPAKPGRAIEVLKGALRSGGTLWVTHPVGYNLDLDEGLRSGEYEFDRLRALRRERRRNVWREVPVEEVWDVAYDRLLYTAHALVVAEYRKP